MRKSVALGLAILMLAVALSPLPVAAQAGGGGITVPISTANFLGTLTIRSFQVIDGAVNAVGTVVGTALTGSNAGTVFVRQVTIPLIGITQPTPGVCQILDLTLGPLDLNLLGLMVHLNQIVLNISAEPGPGNLLGNLLCAIAGLLDPGPNGINQLVAALNRLLSAL